MRVGRPVGRSVGQTVFPSIHPSIGLSIKTSAGLTDWLHARRSVRLSASGIWTYRIPSLRNLTLFLRGAGGRAVEMSSSSNQGGVHFSSFTTIFFQLLPGSKNKRLDFRRGERDSHLPPSSSSSLKAIVSGVSVISVGWKVVSTRNATPGVRETSSYRFGSKSMLVTNSG